MVRTMSASRAPQTAAVSDRSAGPECARLPSVETLNILRRSTMRGSIMRLAVRGGRIRKARHRAAFAGSTPAMRIRTDRSSGASLGPDSEESKHHLDGQRDGAGPWHETDKLEDT